MAGEQRPDTDRWGLAAALRHSVQKRHIHPRARLSASIFEPWFPPVQETVPHTRRGQDSGQYQSSLLSCSGMTSLAQRGWISIPCVTNQGGQQDEREEAYPRLRFLRHHVQ